ncbi:unnamed protein product [Diamesa serratosioi]
MRYYNYEDYEHMIVPTIHGQAQTEWFKNQTGAWNTFYAPKFAEILTTRGYGYSFNVLEAEELLNVDEVSDDFIYDINIILKNSNQNSSKTMNLKNPLSTSAKIHDGLTMNIKRNNSILKSEICLGYGFIVHGSDESPYKFESTSVFEYKFETSVEVVITPVVIYSEENLRKFSPEKRHCYFDDEKKLRFYKKYTMNNCEMECLSNYTLKTCDCIPFDSIRDKYTTVCGINLIDCTRQAEYDVKYDPSSQIFTECDCLPDCSSVKYNVEYIQTKYNPNFET